MSKKVTYDLNQNRKDWHVGDECKIEGKVIEFPKDVTWCRFNSNHEVFAGSYQLVNYSWKHTVKSVVDSMFIWISSLF